MKKSLFFVLEWEKKSGRITNGLEKFILYYGLSFHSIPSWVEGEIEIEKNVVFVLEREKNLRKSQWTSKIHVILRIDF